MGLDLKSFGIAPLRGVIRFAIVILILAAAPCRAAVTVGAWQPIYCGVAYATGSADGAEPRLQQVRAIRVDLLAPGVDFYATPSNGAAAKETTTAKTSTFLKNNGLRVAINAGFFDYTVNAAVGADISGLHVSRGTVVSEATNGFGNCILRLSSDNVAAFATITALPYNTAGIDTAVPGSHFILVNGVPNSDTTTADPRSLAGLSADGRFLVLLTIDGRQSGYSEGATYKECGEWLLRFGCRNGLNLDGGGSTTLARSDGAGGAILLNSPSGSERYVGSHLGVFALDQPPPLTVTLDARGGTVSPASATVTNGLAYGSLPSPARPAYTFGGWWTGMDGAGLSATATTVVAAASNHTLYARWSGQPFTVTFDAQGGTVNPAFTTVTNGLAYGALPTPARADYTFGGWWIGAGGTGGPVTAATTVAVTADVTLFAKWEAIPAVPAFETSATTGRAPFAVTFDDRSTGTITNRYWDFGDGTWTNTTALTLTHVYTNGGAFTVTLVVSGPLGSGTITSATPVVIYPVYANPIPYLETFEPPGWMAGDPLLMPWNSNGWYGDTSAVAVVTNLSYEWPAAAFPVPAATHSNVLGYRDILLTNQFSQGPGQPRAVVDCMNQPGWRRANIPDTNTLADAQASYYADSNGQLTVWCSGDQDHTNKAWITYTNAVIGQTNWARVTVAFDYGSDKVLGLTYFSVALNGQALPAPGGLGYACTAGRFARHPAGVWLVSANQAARQVNSVTFDGSGRLDDFVVTTNALDFIPFPAYGGAAPGGTLIMIR